jgi:hypothetical protein
MAKDAVEHRKGIEVGVAHRLLPNNRSSHRGFYHRRTAAGIGGTPASFTASRSAGTFQAGAGNKRHDS